MDEMQISTLETELMGIDEAKLPEVIATRMNDVAEVNEMYEKALVKKNEAQAKVNSARSKAEKMVDNAAKLGQLNPQTHHFFKHEWSSKKDRIEALETCVTELGRYGVDTAEFQKAIVEIQTATLESQSAVMEVQTKQMEYLEHTTDALKFLYGLSAYGIASTESIVTNLQLVLSGAKKKELGEMAKQQMYLVMDQLKSQENLTLRLKKHEDRIHYIEDSLQIHSDEMTEIDRRIIAGEERDRQQDEALEQQIQKDIEHDEAIAAGIEKDAEQDQKLQEQIQKDKEHDKLIEANRARVAEHDDMFLAQEKKDREQDRLFEEGAEKDSAQDEQIKRLDDRIQELEKQLETIQDGQISKIYGYITMAIAAGGLILGILHFFI